MSQVSTTEAFHAITLDELNNTASLQTRKDRKYIVPLTMVEELATELTGHGRLLAIDGTRTFAYESQYFDTPDRASYLAAVRQRPHRYKVRTRSYISSELCSLEVKTRDGRGVTKKTRTSYEISNRKVLTDKGRAFLQTFTQVSVDEPVLQLALETTYRRTTLALHSQPVRVTVDTELAFRDPDGTVGTLTDHAVVETKTAGSPSMVDRLLWDRGFRPTKISKFGTGLAVLHPELPANKWDRVLRRYFDRVPAAN